MVKIFSEQYCLLTRLLVSISKNKPSYCSTRFVKSQHPGKVTWLTYSHQFKENPDSWIMVDKILESASYPHTKCLHHNQSFSTGIAVDKKRPWTTGIGQRHQNPMESTSKRATSRSVADVKILNVRFLHWLSQAYGILSWGSSFKGHHQKRVCKKIESSSTN